MKKLASVLLVILLLLQLMPFAAAEEAEHVHRTPEITAEETVPEEEFSSAAAEYAEEEEDPVPDGDPAAVAEPADTDEGEAAPSDAEVPAEPEADPDDTLPADASAVEELPAEETETAVLPEEEVEILDVQETRDAAGDTKATTVPTKMWVEASDTNGIPMQIDVFQQDSSYNQRQRTYTYTCILCLPGSAVNAECYLSWDGGMQGKIGTTTVDSGTCAIPTPGSSATTYTFTSGRYTYKFVVTAYKGSSSVASIFIDIDESEGNPTIAQMDGDPDHEVTCTGHIYINGTMYEMPKIKGRGNYTWSQADDKKAYNITLGSKINFPGIDSAKTKKWSILAEISDHSLMCNRSGFALAHQLGVGQDTTSADVWMNGEYQGCYTVTPKYDSFVTDDGYLLEEDNYLETVSIEDGGDPQFELDGMHGGGSDTSHYNLITVKQIGKNLLGTAGETPENIQAVTDQIHAWMQDAWDAIRSSTGYNSKGKYYTDYIDVESFAKMYLMHEYVKSYDVCAGSILFHRDGTSDSDKLIAGPLWDLDNAMGSTQSNNGLGSVADRRSGKGAFITEINEDSYKTSLFKTLYQHEDFQRAVALQYNKNYERFNALPGVIQSMTDAIHDSAMMNHAKVNNISYNLHKYSSATTLERGTVYEQSYLKTSGNATDNKTDWPNYAANLKTYATARSLWFYNTYYDPDSPAFCEHEYAAVVTPPTCKTTGFTTYTCTKCGDTYVGDATAIIDHDYQEGVCSMCGEILRTATIVCSSGASVTVYHTQDITGPHEDNAQTVHPRNSDTGMIDCGGDGQINFVVQLAPGYVLDSVTALPTSSYKNLKLPADTGIENGYRLTKVKGDLTITVEAHCEHDYQGTVTPPTCTAEGYTTYVCRYCGDTYVADTVAALGHDLHDHAAQAPTCTGIGWQAYQTCSRCDYTTYVELAPLGHTPAAAVTENRIEATCTAAGSYDTVVYCSVCHAELSREAHTIAATGHAWGTPTYAWSDDNRQVTATRVCANDPSHVETETVNTASQVAVPATCETQGQTKYTATFQNAAFTTQTKTVTDIPATGHAWGEPTYSWASDSSKVTATRICSNNSSHKQTETANTTSEIVEAATCLGAGSTKYTATFRNTAFQTQTRTVADIPALGHTASAAVIENRVDPTCTTAGSFDTVVYCSVCHAELSREAHAVPATGHAWGEPAYAWSEDNSQVTATRVCSNNSSHKQTETVNTASEIAVPATCEEKGSTKYTATFQNTAFSTQTKTVADIPANGHRPAAAVVENRVEPTCTVDGRYDTVVYCSVCGDELSRETVVLPMTGHDWSAPVYGWSSNNTRVTASRTCGNDASHVETETVSATSAVTTAPGCLTTGVRTYTSAAFANSAFSVQTKTETIPATGHAWGTPTYTWSSDNKTVTAKRVCANDPSHVETETVSATSAVTTAPGCLTTGVRTYTSAAFANSAFAVQTKTETIPATGHDWSEVTYTWASGNGSVTATRTCRNNGSHVETETVSATSAVTTAPGCLTTGVRTYTSAAFANSAFSVQTKTETIPATGHAWGTPTYTWSSDNRTVTAKRVCANDPSHVETETVNTASQVVTPATCETQGKTKYTATFQNSAFKTQTKTVTDIPALGHAWGTPTYTWSADNKTVTAKRICGNDNTHIETETVNTASQVVTPATCETKGQTKYTASFQNLAFKTQTKTVTDIPALGHAWGAPTYTWSADLSKVTATRVCGNDSSHVETETVNTTSTVVKAATCETKGQTKYTAAFANAAFQTQTRTETDIPALGHAWGTPSYAWSADLSQVTATRVCGHDSSHVQTETVNTTSTVVKAATCETMGQTKYTAKFSNSAFSTQTRTETDIPALGHAWGDPTYTWTSDNSRVTATRVCGHDSTHVETETVNTTSQVVKAATCEAKGQTRYTATFQNTAFRTQTKTVTDIPALGHAWGTPGYAWSSDNKTVTATRVCGHDSSHVQTETVNTTSQVVTPATCETQGKTKYTATFQNTAFSTQTKTVTDIPALGHAWGEPTYTWSSDNKTVTAKRVCGHDSSHVETETVNTTSQVVKAATCEAKGQTRYTAAFANPAFETQTKTVTDIPALGHAWGTPGYAWNADLSKVTATRICGNDSSHVQTETVNTTSTVVKAATCEEMGQTKYTARFSNSAFSTQTRTETDIPALGHTEATPVVENRVEPTCTAAGHYDSVVYCSVCGKELSHETVAIPALGHAWGTVTYTWSSDNKTVTAKRVCANDSAHIETETVNTTSTIVKAATCEEMGQTKYTAAFTNTAFGTKSKTVTDIPALGHAWGEPAYVWSSDNKTVTAKRVCAHDNSHVETETANTTSQVVKAATCEEMGQTKYTATFRNTAFSVQPKTVTDIPALGHTPAAAVTENRVEPTCTADGHYDSAVYCSVCHKELSRETVAIPKLGHAWGNPTYTWSSDYKTVTAKRVCANDSTHVETETVDTTSQVVKAATCEEMGQTKYTAVFQNSAFATQTKTATDIPATGHAWSAPVYGWSADNGNVTATRTCTHDSSHIESETVSATSAVTTAPGCLTAGVRTYTSAAFANSAFAVQTRTETIPATGHAWGDPTYVWSSDYKTVTAKRVCAHDNSHVETETANTTSQIVKPAACETMGQTKYTATFTNTAFDTQTRTETDIPALGHAPAAPVTENRVEPTCTAAGHYDSAVYCSVCGKELSRETIAIPATGHAWGNPTYSWSSDNSTVTATRVCANDSAHVETETANVTSAVTKPASCEGKGETTYTAEFRNTAFRTQTKTLDDIPALGHREAEAVVENRVDPTCTETGSYDSVVYCSVCGKQLRRTTVTVPANGHDWGPVSYVWSADNGSVTAARTCRTDAGHIETETVSAASAVTTAPGCETMGVRTYTSAAFGNGAFSVQKKTEDIPATGHAWGDPTYDWSADNRTVTATRVCAHDGTHKETETVTASSTVVKPAACEEKGQTKYTAAFTNEAFAGQTKTVDDIPMTGHTASVPAEENRVEATCTAPGSYDTVVTCTVCGKELSRTTTVLPALGHSWSAPAWAWSEDLKSAAATFTCANDVGHTVTENANVTTVTVAPGPETAGSITYTATVPTPQGGTATDTKVVTIPPAGYTFAEPVYDWTAVGDAGYRVSALKACNEDAGRNITETVEAVFTVTTPAGCETEGQGVWTATFANTAFTAQTRTESIPKTGHAWGDPAYEWSADNRTVTAARVCMNNSSHKETETVNTASAVAVPATCTEKGKTTYTASFTNEAFAEQAKTVEDIDPLGHRAADAVIENRVEPTCTEAGSCDSVVYCSVCGAELSRATKALAPTGHAWGDAAYRWSSDNSTVTATRVCSNDDTHAETETANVTSAVTKPASCEGKGETTYTAAFENPAFEAQTKTLADIPALGHTPGETVIENVTEPSGETDGCHDEAVYCVTCGRELSRRTVVDRALYISKQPEDQNVRAGETAVFTVTAVGENVTYRWQYSSNNGTSWNDCRSAGHDTDTFSFRMTAGLAGRLYRCVVSNDRLSATSEAAKLTRVVDAPVITVQPEDQNVNPGDRAAFEVTAEGEDLTYQWQISKDGGENWRDCTSAGNDAASFGFTAKASYSGWMYRCAVSNAGGSVTSEAVTLTVANGPVITKQPADRTAAPGETVTFTVEATGLNLTYQWQYSKDGGETWRSCTSKGYDTDTFTFAMTEGYGGRLYRCVLKDDTGTTRSSAAALVLSNEGPAITAQPSDQSVTVGQTAVFRIGTAGDGVTYQWQYSTNGGTSWNNCRSRGYDTDTFSFRMTAGLAGRLYRCLATDATGTRRSDAASLTLAAGPAITAHPKDQTVRAGAKATFTTAASGDGVTYQWQVSKDGGVTWKDCTSAGNKTASFGFTAKASYSGWMYRCAIGDANGSTVTDVALLTVN